MSSPLPGIIARYLSSLPRIERQVEATPELSLREPLLVLLKEMGREAGRPNLLVAPEASAEQAGQPDIFVKDEPRLVGFVETKPWARTSIASCGPISKADGTGSRCTTGW